MGLSGDIFLTTSKGRLMSRIMGKPLRAYVAAVLVLGCLGSAQGGQPSGGGLLALPERLAYKVLSVPGAVAQKVLPRTTTTLKNSTRGAEGMAGKAVKGATDIGKETVTTARNLVEGTVNTVGRSVSTVGGAVMKAVRPY
jgi:hypothetical protein